jgi:glycosyltransferase involved in cell wall biosynthesis
MVALDAYAFLLAHPQCIWVLLGGIAVLPSELESIPSNQLKIMPATDDVRSVFRCCDIYVNPPRLGGGFSVAEAMAESLPILAFSQSDGGNKIGDEAVCFTHDYFEKLKELVEHEDRRESLGEKMKQHFFNTLDLASSHASLMQAITTTVDIFNQRKFAKQAEQ